MLLDKKVKRPGQSEWFRQVAQVHHTTHSTYYHLDGYKYKLFEYHSEKVPVDQKLSQTE